MTTDLRRIRYVTQNFDLLQGLRSLPWAIIFLLSAGGMAGWQFFVPAQWGYLEGVVLLACFGAYWWIGTLYARRFGRVERRRSRFWYHVVLIVIVLGAIALNAYVSPPVDLVSLTFSGAFIWMYIEWKERIHYLVIGLILTGITLMPLLPSIGFDGRLWGKGGAAFLAALGLGLIIGGLFDHRLLTQTLPQAPQETQDQRKLSTES